MEDISTYTETQQADAMAAAVARLEEALETATKTGDNGVMARCRAVGLSPTLLKEVYDANRDEENGGRSLCEGVMLGIMFMLVLES